jgi:hypothetical protein
MTPRNQSLDMDYSFNIIATLTGSFTDSIGVSLTLTLSQTIANNILHVGCFCANFTGWNDVDVPLYVNEKNTDIFKIFNNS